LLKATRLFRNQFGSNSVVLSRCKAHWSSNTDSICINYEVSHDQVAPLVTSDQSVVAGREWYQAQSIPSPIGNSLTTISRDGDGYHDGLDSKRNLCGSRSSVATVGVLESITGLDVRQITGCLEYKVWRRWRTQRTTLRKTQWHQPQSQ